MVPLLLILLLLAVVLGGFFVFTLKIAGYGYRGRRTV
jgi:hypothetical protein